MSQGSANVQAIARRFGLLLIVPLVLFLFVEFSSSQRDQLPSGLEVALTEQALGFLRTEYDILLTGNPPEQGLVPRLSGESGIEMTGEERVLGFLNGRERSLEHGKRYTSIEITLNPAGVEERDGSMILHSIAHRVEYFTFDPPPSQAIPRFYEEFTRHDFIFSIAQLLPTTSRKPYTVQVGDFAYTLIKDITEPQLLNVSDQEDEAQEYRRPPGLPLKVTPPIDKQPKQRRP